MSPIMTGQRGPPLSHAAVDNLALGPAVDLNEMAPRSSAPASGPRQLYDPKADKFVDHTKVTPSPSREARTDRGGSDFRGERSTERSERGERGASNKGSERKESKKILARKQTVQILAAPEKGRRANNAQSSNSNTNALRSSSEAACSCSRS